MTPLTAPAAMYLTISTFSEMKVCMSPIGAIDNLRLQMLQELANLQEWHEELTSAPENEHVKQARKDLRIAMGAVTECLVNVLSDRDRVVEGRGVDSHYHYDFAGNGTVMPLSFCAATVYR